MALLAVAIIALAAYAHLAWKQAQGTYTGDTTVTVSGEGEVVAVPDIGQFSFAVRAEGLSADEAQTAAAEAINDIIAYLEEVGVAEADIQTETYNLQPRYRYEERICTGAGYCPPGERTLDGYDVTQRVTVKVRDLDQAGTLVTGVGERGATDISNLRFTIDEPAELQAQARSLAIDDARQKADALARDLEMRVHRVVAFNENQGPNYPMQRTMMAMDEVAGLGGGSAPALPVGEDEIISTVNITYELR